MDGTLLTKSHTISNDTKLAIKRLISKGILIVPISARPLHGMLHIIEGVIPAETPVVSLNGGYIYHQKKIIYEVNIPLAATTAVHKAIESLPLSAMYYSQMNWYALEHTDAIKKEQKITPVPIIIQPFEHTIAAWEQQQLGPNKILIAGDETLILAIEKDLLAAHGEQLNIYKSQPRYLELMNLQASKTMAMKLLMEQYGIQQHEVVAIGDNYNDKGMIEFAGMGVAMGNAPDAIKAVANYVTDTNNNDGVAKALSHFFG
jgi:Cof subfamily protein (haloacid dehalogenase superfamily)